ncbi:MAG: tape measure protein, partial [Actinomycetia bacterium]|nr:tape measure protein [Actinomycetes bacterium]
MVDNSYKKVLDEAQLEVSQLTKKVIELDNAILKMSANLKKIDSKKLYSSETTQLIKEHRRELAKLNKTIDAQHRQIAKLSQKKKEVNALTGKEVANQRILKRNNNLQTQATSRLAGAYGRLVAQQKKLKTALKNSIIETGKSSAKSKQLQHALDKVTISVNKANRATSNFKNTGLGGMVRGFSNLLGAFGIAGGLMMIKDLTKNVFKLSKQFDSFGFAMKKIITDSIELGDTQEFLDRITQDYGVNLITTTERYIKFDAAARQSNLRMAETQNIFETVTKASGVLGLKTHELEGVYLALEQMLSKGKVTTEELRRQLGERLPGAFGIMANALGVSTVKLDKMLKKGEVLSKEALPKFAVELEKAFGLESVKTIDTLQAAQERLSNSWSMFVRDIAGQDTLIQGVFKGVLNFLSKTLESIGDIGDEIKEAFKTDLDKSLEADYGALEKLQKRQEAALNSIKNAHGRLNDASLQRFKIEDNLAKKFFENEKKILGVESAREEFSQKQASNIVEQISKYDDFFKLINDLGLRQDIYDQNAIAAAFARIKGIDKIIEETQNQIDAENELGDELDKNNKKRAKAVSIGKEYQKMLKDRESSVKAVDKEIKKHINTTIDVSDAIKDAKDVTEDAAESERKRLEGIEKMNKALKEMEGFFNEFKSEFLGN